MREETKKALASLTLEQKIKLLSGADNYRTTAFPVAGVPSVMMTDGPVGLRCEISAGDTLCFEEGMADIYRTYPATLLPSTMNLACTFDTAAAYEYGRVLGGQARALSVALLLAPGINVKRSPLCGRNFEYYSEEPFVAGRLAAEYIKGVQNEGTGACIKHYACNNRETRRLTSNSIVEKRALHEVYLSAFEHIVKTANPAAIMSSYNLVNGEYAGECKYLLDTVLRRKWGFKGLIVSDWGGVNDRVRSLEAGLDLEMPTSDTISDTLILDAVKDGTLSEEQVDICAARILDFVFSSVLHKEAAKSVPDELLQKGHEKAVVIAADSFVLLRNEDAFLPLKHEERIVFAGAYLFKPMLQGAGSAGVNAAIKRDPAAELLRIFPKAECYTALNTDGTLAGDNAAFVSAAGKADKVVLFLGLDGESEAFDRVDIDIPKPQREFYARTVRQNPNTAVVLSGGSAKNLAFLRGTRALLDTFLAGEGYAEALGSILCGAVSPSGRLAETYPVRLEDTPAHLYFADTGTEVFYGEGLFVGYRYYDAKKIKTAYPFGFGLSYSSFAYSALKVRQKNETAEATVRVKNTGNMAAKETVLLFFGHKEIGVPRPLKQLCGFSKVYLEAGQETEVKIRVPLTALEYFDTQSDDFVFSNGEYQFYVCKHAEKVLLKTKARLKSKRVKAFYWHRNTTFNEIVAHCGAAGLDSLIADFKAVSGLDIDPRGIITPLTRKIIWEHPLRSIILQYKGKYQMSDLDKYIEKQNALN